MFCIIITPYIISWVFLGVNNISVNSNIYRSKGISGLSKAGIWFIERSIWSFTVFISAGVSAYAEGYFGTRLVIYHIRCAYGAYEPSYWFGVGNGHHLWLAIAHQQRAKYFGSFRDSANFLIVIAMVALIAIGDYHTAAYVGLLIVHGGFFLEQLNTGDVHYTLDDDMLPICLASLFTALCVSRYQQLSHPPLSLWLSCYSPSIILHALT